MVSIPMKANLFKEKMTSLRIFNTSNDQILSTIVNFDLYPGSVHLVAFLDFFNLRPDTNYILSVTAHFPDGTNYPVHATRVNIAIQDFVLLKDGYGKATGNFDFNFTIQAPSDFLFLFVLLDENGKEVDTAYSYHHFGTWGMI
ncbi:hypothetical protein Q7W21_10195 [Streptococcus suis]|uniref:Uncharacterized protein n=1 Tax=Streptococcus suis TaxID=1307 RepID=A0A3R8T7K6_STRSU|nr:hypothetical protein [Streptococcus suis]MDW8584696.1 hypothetical protein [Streptococcus suis]MDW8719115.1 hypothetical protein [Streptococcus suis]RRN48008.1 hypothetical protein EI220_12530 [Streptococcus suis]HEL1839175.1 hypothetical protein [Streptococcus suis]HEL1992436.1 hypothetical protein [Streptococcus suis]